MIAIVEICDVCGTRYQGVSLLPLQRCLDAVMRVINTHLPAPGEQLHFACPKCAPEAYPAITPLELEVWERGERRARGELPANLDVDKFRDDPAILKVGNLADILEQVPQPRKN